MNERSWTSSDRRLAAVIIASVIVFVADIVVLNVVGEVPSAWWLLAVPVGLFVVPVAAIVCSAQLVARRRARVVT